MLKKFTISAGLLFLQIARIKIISSKKEVVIQEFLLKKLFVMLTINFFRTILIISIQKSGNTTKGTK